MKAPGSPPTRPERRLAGLLAPPPTDDDNTSWLVTFSDLVLQLFAFVLVAVVLGGNGRTAETAVPPPAAVVETVVATAIAPAIAPAPTPPPPPAPACPPPVEIPPPAAEQPREEHAVEPADPTPPVAEYEDAARRRVTALAGYLHELARAAGREDAVTVTIRDSDMVLTLSDRISFPSGSADLLPAALPILGAIRTLVSSLPDFTVSVEGHTDDVPIHTPAFPSNLELSLARAARVAHELTADDTDLGARTAAAGFGEHRPVAPNADEEGRAQNRRVEIRLVPRNA